MPASSRLSERVERIAASATMAAGEMAARLRRDGVKVLDLGPGQPDFDTPEHICEAAIRATREGRTRYTATAGIPELREAIADMYARREGVAYRPEEVAVSCGGKQGLYNAIMALVNPGDEVILPTPFWVSFPEQIQLAGATPVYVDTAEDDGFALRADAVMQACSERTRMIVLNTPSNPSGAVIDRSEMRAIARLALERDIYLLVDECYASLVYEGHEHVTPLSLGAEARERTVLCGSCSKTYAMTGWRIGYVAAPRAVIDAMTRMQGHTTSNPCSVSQYAALAAISGDQTPARKMLQTFAERREEVLPRLRALPGVRCGAPHGAFYLFPNVQDLLGAPGSETSAELATTLIEDAHVVTVPGSAFGRDGYLRLSYATSMEVLEEALERIGRTCARLLEG